MTEPRWRRGTSEPPPPGADYMVTINGGRDVIHCSTSLLTVDHPDLMWMPESEWRDVLARIPEPAEKGEHVVITFEDDDGYYVTQWPQFAETSKAIRCSYKQDAETVAAALNAYEGRTP